MEQEPEIVRLVITFNQRTGDVNVQGPLANKVMCYGLLKLAEITIQKYQIPKEGPRIVAPPAVGVPH